MASNDVLLGKRFDDRLRAMEQWSNGAMES